MQGAGGDKGMDAAASRVFQRFAGAGDIAFVRTRQRADRCILDGVGNGLHAFEITVGAGRKACFDHVHAQALQLAGNADFFIACHAGAGRLFAVTQGGIENNDSVAHGDVLLGSSGFAVAYLLRDQQKSPVQVCKRAWIVIERVFCARYTPRPLDELPSRSRENVCMGRNLAQKKCAATGCCEKINANLTASNSAGYARS